MSRSKNIVRNVTASILSQIILVICGLITPKLILSNYGSDYNGITQSISQFISYISLMQAGIGGATTAALYKPLANKDFHEISEIIISTKKYMRKVSYIFVAFVLGLAIIYPTFIVKDFDFLFTAALIVIISFSTFSQYYFYFSYQCLINADQKGYIVTSITLITTVINTFLSAYLISLNLSIILVKLSALFVNLIHPIVLYLYVKKHYPIDEKLKVTEDKIPQKWNAAAHEIASFVNNNTDIVIITAMIGVKEVSVYTVYHYVTSSIKRVITNFSSGFGAAFGDMYAKNEIDLMNKNLGLFEVMVYSLATIFCGVSLVMIVPFALLYAEGVTDISYDRPVFAMIAVSACAFNCFRLPYRSIVYAVGHYKQTRNGAIFEAVMNITISIIGVYKFGLVGVAIGTLFALCFRTFQFALYLSNHILHRDIKIFISHIAISFIIMFGTYFLSKLYMKTVSGWFMWIVYAAITTIIVTTFVVITDYLFYKEDFIGFIKKLQSMVKGRILR